MKRSPLRPSSSKATRARRAAQPVVDDAFARDGGCVLAVTTVAGSCWGPPTPHHIVKAWRSKQGWIHRNLVTLCAHHNGWVEDQPTAARRLGLVADEFADLREAWSAMRTHCLAAGRLEEPCPGSGQPGEAELPNGRHRCGVCGHGHGVEPCAGGWGGWLLVDHTREMDW